jgi:transposase InsO family protein
MRNKRWTIDETVLNISNGKEKLRVLHIVDLATKCILNTLVTTKDFNAAHINRATIIQLRQQGVQDFDDKEKRLIIHTDRDKHFTSKTWFSLLAQSGSLFSFYENLENEFPKKVVLSMSPSNTLLENAVSERTNGRVKKDTGVNLILKSHSFRVGFVNFSLLYCSAKTNKGDLHFL